MVQRRCRGARRLRARIEASQNTSSETTGASPSTETRPCVPESCPSGWLESPPRNADALSNCRFRGNPPIAADIIAAFGAGGPIDVGVVREPPVAIVPTLVGAARGGRFTNRPYIKFGRVVRRGNTTACNPDARLLVISLPPSNGARRARCVVRRKLIGGTRHA